MKRFAKRKLKNFFGAWGKWNVTRWSLLSLANYFLNLITNGVEVDSKRLESLSGDSFSLVNKTQKNVLGTDVVVI